MNLITAAEVGTLLSVSPSDQNLIRLVNAANRGAMKYTRRSFNYAQRTEIVRGYGRDHVFLSESPIARLIDVRVDWFGLGAPFDDSTVVDVTQFWFDADPLRDDPQVHWMGGWQRLNRFPETPCAARIIYEAGWYETADPDDTHQPRVPDDLRSDLMELVKDEYRAGLGERLTSERIGDYSYTRSVTSFNDRLREIVRPYRRP